MLMLQKCKQNKILIESTNSVADLGGLPFCSRVVSSEV